MLLFENKEQKLLNTLKFLGSPFKKFVSTEIKEEIGLVQSRQEFLQQLMNIIDKNENFVLPIIGEVGQGKTHLYWALKNALYDYNIVYISLETVIKKFYYNTYSEFIENLGVKPDERVEPLRNMTKRLCNEWGGQERKFGFFQVADIERARQAAFKKWARKFEKKDVLNDIITAIIAHQLEPYKKIEAERWLIGELMDVRELSRLNLKHDLRKRDYAFAMLKVLIENLNKKSVIFIDDVEKLLSIRRQSYGESEEVEEIEEIFDPKWLYGDKKPLINPSAEKTFDKIIDLHKIKRLRIIITFKSIENFEEIKKKIERKNRKLLMLLKKPLLMSNFIEEDIFEFYKNSLEFFFASVNYSEYFKYFSTSFFPLNETVLRFIFQETNGNPREIIKYLIKIFNEIVTSNENLEDILVQMKI
ncbi:MAG: hypothetical protein ACXABO_03785 [Promethearchaeota archaeon]|jgi:hypothetical protein